MKISIFLLCLILFGFRTVEKGNSEIINRIFNSNRFVITVERNDLGYSHNIEKYDFELSENYFQVVATRSFNSENKLIKQYLNREIIDSIRILCINMESFEFDNPRRFKRYMNSKDVLDLVLLTNHIDTVKIVDFDYTFKNHISKIIEK